jgi:hypothetical protein
MASSHPFYPQLACRSAQDEQVRRRPGRRLAGGLLLPADYSESAGPASLPPLAGKAG